MSTAEGDKLSVPLESSLELVGEGCLEQIVCPYGAVLPVRKAPRGIGVGGSLDRG